ncbi:hypothetical protein [Mesonia mobilis]|uniref:Lipoprotein n=1 Tax=Mesonia mobilis TaxID=369791 RepID=A0ABQ3BJK7_9FLAO|nr:hypothetical protein [Mesonia mobilis]GGZ48432.1 hypothetical protein GCM10008088_07060 [Mesonia mobilis]
MKKQILTSVLCGLSVLSCQSQSNKPTLDNEIEKWKKELILTGELGNPCNYDSFQKWIEENPDQVFGISDNITIKKTDFNNDGMVDAFVSMEVEPCNGGNATSSDYSVLIFSNEGEYYKDVKLTERIEKKIKSELAENGVYSIWKLSTSLKSFDGTINGETYIWIDEDASCCPSYSGNFEYNPETQELKSEITKE